MTSNKKTEFFEELDHFRSQNNVVGFYDKHAGSYDSVLGSASYQDIVEEASLLLERKIVEEVQTPKEIVEILDIGCGSGLSGNGLRSIGFNLVDGVDASQKMLDTARPKKIYRNLIQGKLTSDEHFQIKDNLYDAVFCIGTITKNHIDLKYALPEFYRILKPAGVAVYSISNTLNHVEALKEHLSYFEDNQFQLLTIKKCKYYDGKYCQLYAVQKLKNDA